MPKRDDLIEQISTKAKEIHADAYPMSIGELISIYRDGDLDIHPEFQRFFRWSDLQKSKFVESILLGIPIPSIFVSQRKDGVWDVVDGVQRLSTIFEFTGNLRDEKDKLMPPSRLLGTDYLPGLEGMVWKDNRSPGRGFSDTLRRDFKRQKLDLKILKRESDEETKYDLFERLNTLGSKLSDQEVRNCLLVMLNIEMYRWLENLTAFKPFQEVISISERGLEERYDMELVLRFILLTRGEKSTFQSMKDLDAFITKGMRELALDPSFDRNLERRVFKKTFRTLRDVFGPECLVRQEKGKGRGGFLISVFEVVAVGLGYGIRRSPNKKVDMASLKEAYASFSQDKTFRKYSKSGRSASSRIPILVPLGRELFNVV